MYAIRSYYAMYLESHISAIKNWFVKAVVGAFVLGALIYIFPPLWGEGYTSITDVFNNEGANFVITSYSIHYTKLYEKKNAIAEASIKSTCEAVVVNICRSNAPITTPLAVPSRRSKSRRRVSLYVI